MIEVRTHLQEALGTEFRLVRELSGGGMSRVFLAEELALSREVVVKLLSPELVGPDHVERFRQETLRTARLQHPSIVPVLKVGTMTYPTGAVAPYYIMPYIRGESLRSRLVREGPFTIASALRILRDVLEALVHAHHHGIIHRDIKPENVFIAGGHAVVTDFGIAKALLGGDRRSITNPGIAVGTPAYMAPEQAVGDPSADHRVDIYAVGVLAYELFVGRTPFAGHSLPQAMVEHSQATPPPITDYRTDLPSELTDAVMKCLAKDPADRWQTADEIARVLEDIRLSDPQAAARIPGAGFPTKRRRSRTLLWAGLAIIVALGAYTVFNGPEPAPAAERPWSIAVLIPELIGDTTQLRPMAQILQVQLTHELQRPGTMPVLDYHAAMEFERADDISRHAARNRVRYTVRSTLRALGSGYRATVSVVDAQLELQIKGGQFDAADSTGVDALILAIGDSLKAWLNLVPLAGTLTREYRPSTPEVRALIIRADAAKRTRTRRGLLESIELLEQAVALDPTDAPAYASLSNAHTLLLVYMYQAPFDPYESAARALGYARRAIVLDSTSDEAYTARAYILNHLNAPTEIVRADFEHALALNRSIQPGWYSVLLAREGQKEAALAEAERGVSFDPTHPGRRLSVAWSGMGVGEYDVAARGAEVAFELAPQLDHALGVLARALLADGRFERCAALHVGPYRGTRAACLEAMGRRGEARAVIDSMLTGFVDNEAADTISNRTLYAQELAIYFAWVGEPVAALFWARQAFDQAPNGIPFPFLHSRLFDRVMTDPTFSSEIIRLEAAGYPRVERMSGRILDSLSVR